MPNAARPYRGVMKGRGLGRGRENSLCSSGAPRGCVKNSYVTHTHGLRGWRGTETSRGECTHVADQKAANEYLVFLYIFSLVTFPGRKRWSLPQHRSCSARKKFVENSIFIWKEDEMSRIIQAMRADPKGFLGEFAGPPDGL